MRSDLREDSMHTSIARTSVAHTPPRPLRWPWLWLLCICGNATLAMVLSSVTIIVESITPAVMSLRFSGGGYCGVAGAVFTGGRY